MKWRRVFDSKQKMFGVKKKARKVIVIDDGKKVKQRSDSWEARTWGI
jgi:hypothetical protein